MTLLVRGSTRHNGPVEKRALNVVGLFAGIGGLELGLKGAGHRTQLLCEFDEAASAVLLGAAPLLQDQKVQSYVNRVGLWIALQTERADARWRFAVLDDNTINAFAAPGGYIFISRGLFMSFRNEAELAGVLAHEIGHVLARHHVEAMVNKARTSAVLDIAKDASGHQGLLSDALLSASKSLYSSGLDQSDEYEADLIGVVLAARAGYDPYGLVHTLMTLQGASGDAELLGFMLSTHPSFEKRLEALHGAMAGPVGQADGKSPATLLKAMQARLR